MVRASRMAVDALSAHDGQFPALICYHLTLSLSHPLLHEDLLLRRAPPSQLWLTLANLLVHARGTLGYNQARMHSHRRQQVEPA